MVFQTTLFVFSGQLAQPSPANNLAKPAECFSAVEKLFMACCTMQPEDDAALPRSDGDPADDQEVRSIYQRARGKVVETPIT